MPSLQHAPTAVVVVVVVVDVVVVVVGSPVVVVGVEVVVVVVGSDVVVGSAVVVVVPHPSQHDSVFVEPSGEHAPPERPSAGHSQVGVPAQVELSNTQMPPVHV